MRVIGLYFFLFPQTLENDLQSQKAELDDLKEDMLKKNLDVATVEKTLAEAGVNLEEAIPPAPDMDVEIEFVVEQFSGYIIAVQEWGAWFGPALATLERCKETYKNRSTLEDMNDKLQVSLKQMYVLILGEEEKGVSCLEAFKSRCEKISKDVFFLVCFVPPPPPAICLVVLERS